VIRYQSTSDLAEIFFSYRVCFSKRSWPYLSATALSWLARSGQRTVRSLGQHALHRRAESGFYRFFSHFKIDLERLSEIGLSQIVATFGLTELLLVVDDTLCPKWGRKIFGAGVHFDHVRRPRPGYLWGHNWVVLAVVVRLFGVPVALPFCVRLYRTKKTCAPEEFQTRLQMVATELAKVRALFPSMKIDLLADGAYNNKSLLIPLRRKLKIHLVSRLRFDAVLRQDPPKRRPNGKRGRKSRYGERLPSLKKLARSGKGWKRIRVSIYGKRVRLKIKSFDAWWPKSAIKVRVVITRDPAGRRKPCFLMSTDLTLTPQEIIERFALRWPIEQLFSDAKLLMGLDSAEVRTQRSVLRHAALTFALVAWVRIWARKHLANAQNPPASFAGQLSALRGDLLSQTIFASSLGRKLSKRNCEDLARLAA
jgi:hypothetical protein